MQNRTGDQDYGPLGLSTKHQLSVQRPPNTSLRVDALPRHSQLSLVAVLLWSSHSGKDGVKVSLRPGSGDLTSELSGLGLASLRASALALSWPHPQALQL